MRAWIRRLDDVHHPANGMMHYAVLGRPALQALSPDRLEAMLQAMPNRRDRALRAAAARLGVEAPEFAGAVWTQEEMLDAFDETLVEQNFPIGEDLTQADLVALPYVARLEQMGLMPLIDDTGRAHLARWYRRLKSRSSYRDTIGALPPPVIERWQSLGPQAWPAIVHVLRRKPATGP